MDDLSTSSTGPTILSFDEEAKIDEDNNNNNTNKNGDKGMMVADCFNDILPQLNHNVDDEEDDDDDDMDHLMNVDSEATSGMDHLLDPDTNLITLEWESSLLPDCFLNHSHPRVFGDEMNASSDDDGDGGGFMDTTVGLATANPTEVSDEEMTDFDTSTTANNYNDSSSSSSNSNNDSDSMSQSMEHRFQETAKRLAISMEKSRKSRVSLTLNSPTVAEYKRRTSLDSIVSSVQESSQQLLATFGGGKAAEESGSRSPSLSSASDS